MPGPSKKSPRPFAFLWWACALLALLHLPVIALGLPPAEYKDRDSFVWHTKFSGLESGRYHDARGIVLGDSQVMSGVLPRLLESAVGGPVYNLGLPSLQPEGVAAMVPHLKRMPRLRIVILGVSPFSLFHSEITESFRGYARRELWPRRPGLLLEFPYLIGDASSVLRQTLDLSPLYRMRYTLNDVDSSRVKDPGFAWNPLAPALSRRQENRRIASLLRRESGHWSWNYVGEDPAVCPADAPPARAFPGRLPYPERKGAGSAYRKILSGLTKAFSVYLIQLPLSETWRGVVDADEVYGRLDAHLAVWRREYPELRIVPRPDPTAYTGADFIDWTHLSYCGARRYTRGLVRIMRESKSFKK